MLVVAPGTTLVVAHQLGTLDQAAGIDLEFVGAEVRPREEPIEILDKSDNQFFIVLNYCRIHFLLKIVLI